jgi:hypothetical protein
MKSFATARERNGASHRPHHECVGAARPVASAIPLTRQPPRELDEINTYLTYPKGATASHLLSWSHYFELLKLGEVQDRMEHGK